LKVRWRLPPVSVKGNDGSSALKNARTLKSAAARPRPARTTTLPRRPISGGSDVIAFADSINRGVWSEFFGAERNNSIRKLVTAAIECFAIRGYQATTTRDIARRARMSPAALYVHFRSKNELLFKLTIVTASAVLKELQRTAAIHASPSDRLGALVAAYVRCNARMHTTVHVAIYEFDALDRRQQRAVVVIRRQIKQLFADCLNEGEARGGFQVRSAQQLRAAIMWLCNSVSQWYSPKGTLTPEQLGDLYAGYVLKIVEPDHTTGGGSPK
jgi:AcrR family transcriptional regulator